MRSKEGWTEEERNREEVGSNEDLISLDYRNADDRSACERHTHSHVQRGWLGSSGWEDEFECVAGKSQLALRGEKVHRNLGSLRLWHRVINPDSLVRVNTHLSFPVGVCLHLPQSSHPALLKCSMELSQ